MNIELDIIITHYTEPEEICEPLFSSLAHQQGVDFSKIRLIVVEDTAPEKAPLSKKFLHKWRNLKVIQILATEHLGISGVRNLGLSRATAPYVMFCDCDDMFFSALGLSVIFAEIEEGSFDVLVPSFVEEGRLADGSVVYVPHGKDKCFVHGKVYRRRYLVENGFKFDPEVVAHEDGCFNAVVLNSSFSVRYIDKPYYLWRWRDNSTCRTDLYVLKTYDILALARHKIAEQLIAKGNKLQGCLYCAMFLIDSYYSYNIPKNYSTSEYEQILDRAMGIAAVFYKDHKHLIDLVAPSDLTAIAVEARRSAVSNGMRMERITFFDWLEWIKSFYSA